jgi:hypothetical protein
VAAGFSVSTFGECAVWELDPPTKLAVICRQCGSAWDESNVPGDVIDTLTELLEQGRFAPRTPNPANGT